MVIASSRMEHAVSPQKKVRSPSTDAATPVNPKSSITCTNVPDGLFDPNAAKRHFSKFGKVQKIKLFLKRKICIIEYEQPAAVERALLNAGAFDGFMFDVSRYKAKVRRRSKRDDDPDWVPDPDVEKELSAMRGAPMYRTPRQKAMDVSPATSAPKPQVKRVFQQSPVRKKVNPVREKIAGQPASGIDTPVAVMATQTSMSTSEAAAELNLLRNRVSHTADEQWRILDARDRILRAWGGAGSRVKVGGATIGTCPDMCPEKERLHRMAEHQVMTLETVPDSDGKLDPMRAVKQYSRSSADQEIPMCYELRPPAVLMNTCTYLLHQVADTNRPVSMADWFHFMWDRFRGIRKDITQQALCCAESIKLVEMCARFHAHCAARLADLEHTQFDQKLNTDNLTKCLQTLKHMYTDVQPEDKPREAEFRGYVALLNLGDANFWWEIKQLPESIQKSDAIIFAIQVFNALDNNNYVRFFRLVKEKATYLQACILLRYFNDVRARALARMVKAYAPRGGSRFPAQDIINALAFESVDAMKSFINHYGLRFAKTDDIDLAVILDRNQFIEDSDPYPLSRSKELIESKRRCLVGEVIAGGPLQSNFNQSSPYSSFNKDGTLKEAALISEDQGYNTLNDSNKNIQALKLEITRLVKSGKPSEKINLFVNPDIKAINSLKAEFYTPVNESAHMKTFSFKPAITVAPIEELNNSPEKVNEFENNFSFSKPQETISSSIFSGADRGNLFKANTDKLESIPIKKYVKEFSKPSLNLFSNSNKNNDQVFNKANIFKENKTENDLKKGAGNVFSQASHETDTSKNMFGGFPNKNVFMNKGMGDIVNNNNIFSKVKNDGTEEPDGKIPRENVFKGAIEKESSGKFSTNIFANVNKPEGNKIDKVEETPKGNIFGNFKSESKPGNIFSRLGDNPKSPFAVNGEANQTTPGNLFKSAIAVNSDPKYSIFQSKNKTPTVADNIFNSAKVPSIDQVYEFAQNDEEERIKSEQLRLQEERQKEDEKRRREEIRKEQERKQEIMRQEEERRLEMIRLEEEKRKEEQKNQEIKRQEEKRLAEEKKKQEELRKKIEEEKLKRQIEEERKRFQQRVDTESDKLINELIDEIKEETVLDLLKDEVEKLNCLMLYAKSLSDDICVELCNEICHSEMKAEKFLTEKLIKKWFFVWRKQFLRNIKRRRLLEDTPVWLPDSSPIEEAMHLRRLVEKATLKNMNAIHRGYKFSGDLNVLPHPEPFNIMEIIKSSLLKRMKQLNYPYDKCFFWKVTIVSPGPDYWLYRKIDLENWLLKALGDQNSHDASESLINVGKHSWNNLMDFAISVGMTNLNNLPNSSDIIENAHGLIFYATENDHQFIQTIKDSLKLKYPYQIIPVAIIMSSNSFKTMSNMLNEILTDYVKCNSITAYRIFVVDSNDISSSLTNCTKSALKWVAKNYPQTPPLEIDYLKSICERYLGNEIWHRFRTERDSRMKEVLKDAYKLVNCFNASIDKLIEVVTNEDLFNYPDFPLEFKTYLDGTSPYPKPYEFIPSAVKTSENANDIKDILNKLKLPIPEVGFRPISVDNMQDQIRSYCNQIGWFEDPEEVVCKVVAVLPQQLSDLTIPSEEFRKHFEKYDLIDFLNVIVYEKINTLKSLNKRFAIYEKNVLDEYRSANWLYEINVLMGMKHKALDYDDDEIELLNEAKRRKLAVECMDYPMLEENDCSIVYECLNATDLNISKYTNCSEAVKQLECKLEEEKQKSIDLENLLRAALSDA